MPSDTRRICGPADETRAPLDEKRLKEDRAKRVVIDGKRQDGRTCDEIRKIFVRANAVTQAKGSAYIETGKTKIICSIYGPRESLRRQEFRMKGKLTCEIKYAPFSCKKRRSPIRDSEEKDLSNIIKQALEPAIIMEKFPKAQIDIYIMVLENDGNGSSFGIISGSMNRVFDIKSGHDFCIVLAGAINCATVALVEAGIEMYDVVIASSLVQSIETALLDPLCVEESSEAACGLLTVAFLPVLNQISVLNMDGELSLHQTNQAVQQCIEACARIYPVICHCITEHIKRTIKEPQLNPHEPL